MKKHNLVHPNYNPPNCPEWVKENLPDFIEKFRGRNGMPSPYIERKYAIGMDVSGIDRYHANQFIVYRRETAEYLYSEYTALKVQYIKGTLPSYERLAAKVIEGCSETEKAQALLFKGVMNYMRNPCVPPLGKDVKTDRNLDDEALLASGSGWCNEQTRVFIRLCQVSNIPARIIQLFYSDTTTGHCVPEFYADGRWCMADATWFCVFPGADGKLLSAAQCHDKGEGQKYCGIAYHKRFKVLIKLADDLKVVSRDRSVWALPPEQLANRMNCFGVINYPLKQKK